jgi:hypothetical protein
MSFIKPPLALPVYVNSYEPTEIWEEGSPSDQYYGYPYRWRANIAVNYQDHGDNTSAIPNSYSSDDVRIGMWLCGGLGGTAVQIVEIEINLDNHLVVIVEDVERFNIVSEPSSSSTYGSGSVGDGVIFELGDDGIPVLTPVQPLFAPTFVTDLMSRFRYRNLLRSFVRVNQPGHTMQLGDVIRPDFANPGKFVKAKADANVASVIGVVSDVNIPSESWFNFKPFGEIREHVKPDLVGNYGDFFYVDPTTPGALTKTRPFNNARPIYMRLENANRAMLLTGSESLDHNETKRYDVVSPAADQVNFVVPADAEEVLWMSINGIENKNYTFDIATKAIVFDPVATGYGVDVTDEVFFIYKS